MGKEYKIDRSISDGRYHEYGEYCAFKSVETLTTGTNSCDGAQAIYVDSDEEGQRGRKE